MDEDEAREAIRGMVSEGMAKDNDEAAHMLVDMGEIDSMVHWEVLSEPERKRVYGE
jgi:hypothetical protein